MNKSLVILIPMGNETFLFVGRMSRILTLSCIMLLGIAEVQAQTIDTVNYVFNFDNHRFTSKNVRFPIESDQFQKFVIQTTWNNGYFEALLDSVNEHENQIHLWFDSGSRFKWNDTPVLWKYPASKIEHTACRSIEKGVDFQIEHLEKCLKIVSDDFFDQGYFSPTIKIDSLEIDFISKRVRANVFLDRGSASRVDKVVFDGITKGNPHWLKRVLGLDSEKILSQDLIQRSVFKINKLQFYDLVDPPSIFNDRGQYGVFFHLTEKPLAHFDLIAGYIPSSSGNSSFVGNGALKIRNVVTDGLDVSMLFDRIEPRIGKLKMGLDQNYFLGFPLGLTSSFSLIQQDTLWQSRDIRIGSWIELSDDFRILLSYSSETSVSGNNVNTNLSDQKGRFGSFELIYNNRMQGDESEPGWVLTMNAQSGTQRLLDKKSNPNSKISRKRLTLDVVHHLRIWNRNNLVSGFHIGFLFKKEPQTFDYWRLGGTQTIRGYREDQFFTKDFVWADLEYRYFLEKKSYLFAFGQLGKLKLGNTLPKDSDDISLTRSFGLGLAYSTNLGIFKFTYAKSPEDPFTNAKVHMGIQADF